MWEQLKEAKRSWLSGLIIEMVEHFREPLSYKYLPKLLHSSPWKMLGIIQKKWQQCSTDANVNTLKVNLSWVTVLFETQCAEVQRGRTKNVSLHSTSQVPQIQTMANFPSRTCWVQTRNFLLTAEPTWRLKKTYANKVIKLDFHSLKHAGSERKTTN